MEDVVCALNVTICGMVDLSAATYFAFSFLRANILLILLVTNVRSLAPVSET